MFHLGKYEPAFHKANTALTQFQLLGSRRGRGYALLMMGWANLGTGQTTEAQPLLQKSLTIYREIGQRDELAQALVLLGYSAYRLDDPGQAQKYLTEGLHTATQIRAFMPMMLALPTIALLLSRQNRKEEAIELYALTSRYPFVAESQWFEQIGEHLNRVARSLPAQIATSARERGRAKALEDVVDELLKANLKI